MSSVYSRILAPNVSYLKNVDWFRLNYTLKRQHAQPNADNLQVLFKNKHFLIVNKPYDLIVYDFRPGGFKPSANTLVDLLAQRFPFNYDPRLRGGFHVLHRLDAVTSGCMCVPLNYFSYRVGLEAFLKKKAQKYYIALVYGAIDTHQSSKFHGVTEQDDSLLIDVPVGDNTDQLRYSRCTPIGPSGQVAGNCLDPQESRTLLKVLEYGTYKGKAASKVLLQAMTGRRHQLRVHLKYLGHPVVGDVCYGKDDDFDTYRTMLHAYKLKIRIDTHERMFVKGHAPDPFLTQLDPDWQSRRVLHQLEKLKI